MRIILTLTKQTLDATFNKLKWILEKPFIIDNKDKHFGGTLYKDYIISNLDLKTELVANASMILFQCDDSYNEFWCEGDKFEFINDDSVIITTIRKKGNKDIISKTTFSLTTLTKKEHELLSRRHHKKPNKIGRGERELRQMFWFERFE